MINNLNKVLATMSVLRQTVLNAHWNVEGSNFLELHTFLEDNYNTLSAQIDELAERIRFFGEFPISTLAEFLEISVINEPSVLSDRTEIVKHVRGDFKSLSELISKEIESEDFDVVTEDMLIGILKTLEKSMWMLSSMKN